MTRDDWEVRRRIKQAFHAWAELPQYRDQPVVLQTANGHSYTPQQIAAEVEMETEFGRTQIAVVLHATQLGLSLDEILEGLTRQGTSSGPIST
jgi:hypothetical protein